MVVFRSDEQHLVFIIFLIYRFVYAPTLRFPPSYRSKSILLSAEKLAMLFCWTERKKLPPSKKSFGSIKYLMRDGSSPAHVTSECEVLIGLRVAPEDVIGYHST